MDGVWFLALVELKSFDLQGMSSGQDIRLAIVYFQFEPYLRALRFRCDGFLQVLLNLNVDVESVKNLNQTDSYFMISFFAAEEKSGERLSEIG